MKKIVWFGLVVLQELKMLKFKSIFRYLYDSRYRKDINNLCKLLKHGKYVAEIKTLKLSDIKFSHDVTYPLWVMSLVRKLDAGQKLPPIKVIYDFNQKSYIVVDGNHRLMAMKLTLAPTSAISVRILYRETVWNSFGEENGA